jgi:hypothetical protein
MRWSSWQGLAAWLAVSGSILLTYQAVLSLDWDTCCLLGWAGNGAGLALLGVGALPSVKQPMLWPLVYAVLLAVSDPMRLVANHRQSWPAFDFLLAPLVVAGVLAARRGQWWSACGAWLVLLAQFLALVYNLTNRSSGVGGCWGGWIA